MQKKDQHNAIMQIYYANLNFRSFFLQTPNFSKIPPISPKFLKFLQISPKCLQKSSKIFKFRQISSKFLQKYLENFPAFIYVERDKKKMLKEELQPSGVPNMFLIDLVLIFQYYILKYIFEFYKQKFL